MSTKLSLSYRQSILERHEAGQRADETLRSAILCKLEQTRQTGQLISDAAGDLKDEQFAAATDFLSKPAISAYLKFARLNPDPITELENAVRAIHLAMQTSGALEFPDGHGPQRRHENPAFLDQIIASAAGLAHRIRQQLKSHPLRDWDRTEVEHLVAGLQPVVAISTQLRNFLR